MPTSAHCHKRVAKEAKLAAAHVYDELMSSSNQIYARWRAMHPQISDPSRLRQEFVNKKWGMFIDMARTTLGLLLREPIDEKTKDEIVEILALDATLIRGRLNPAQVAGQLQQKQ